MRWRNRNKRVYGYASHPQIPREIWREKTVLLVNKYVLRTLIEYAGVYFTYSHMYIYSM